MKEEALVTLGVAALFAVSGYAVYARDQPRPGVEIVEAAQRALQSIEFTRDELLHQPLLQSLDASWTGARFLLESCGITVTPLDPETFNTDEPILYAGPVPAWHAQATGPTPALLACLDQVNVNFSISIGRFTITPTESNAVYSVLGAIPATSP